MATISLLAKERKFLARQIRYRKAFLVFCWAGLIASLILLVHHAFKGNMDGKTGALILLILLQSRANLKQYKDAGLLEKFSRGVAIEVEEKPREGGSSA